MQNAAVIPIYKRDFSHYEKISIDQNYNMLKKEMDIVIVKPYSLDLDFLKTEYPEIIFESFDDEYFKNIAGYNKLMMSGEFYNRLIRYDYILICQLDTYIFKSDINQFINKGYDYIGAPWIERRLYKYLPFLKTIKYRKKKYSREDITWEQNLSNKVGNGGLSLRKVKSCLDVTVKYDDIIKIYNNHPNMSIFNEDGFWSHEPKEFNYPTTDEALKFSFDKYPSLCYKLNKNTLPFGCHGWSKWKWINFWKKYIPKIND